MYTRIHTTMQIEKTVAGIQVVGTTVAMNDSSKYTSSRIIVWRSSGNNSSKITSSRNNSSKNASSSRNTGSKNTVFVLKFQ